MHRCTSVDFKFDVDGEEWSIYFWPTDAGTCSVATLGNYWRYQWPASGDIQPGLATALSKLYIALGEYERDERVKAAKAQELTRKACREFVERESQ